MTVLDFIHELALAIESDTLDVKQRLAEQINNRWGDEFRQVAEEMPEADLPIAGDWLEDRGFVVAGRILRTWRGLAQASLTPSWPEHVWMAGRRSSATMADAAIVAGIVTGLGSSVRPHYRPDYACFMLTDCGFRFSCGVRRPAKRRWVRGGRQSVPLICVETVTRHRIAWRSYDAADTLHALSRQAEIGRIAGYGEHLYRTGWPPGDYQRMMEHIHTTTDAAYQHLSSSLSSYFWGNPDE